MDTFFNTPAMLNVTVGAVFVAVALVAGLVTAGILASMSAERKRLAQLTRAPEALPLPEILPLAADTTPTVWTHLEKILPKSLKELSRLRMRLGRAGFKHPSGPFVYSMLEYIAPLVLGAIPLYLLHGRVAWFAAALGAFIGYMTPGLILEQRLSVRRRDIENGLPDALDLLVVCIEAGSGIDQAIVRTSEELAIAYPVLADELRIMTAEIRAGKPRIEAFKSLAQRTKVDDVRSLVSILVQTDRFGTSVGQALRTHSDVARSKRRQRAEERAQKLGVKLVFPLVLCFFPAFYVVVLGPAVIQFVRTFMNK